MTTSELLRRIRRRGGWSLRRLAERAGTSHSALAAYEAGRVDPGSAVVERIVAAAGFEVVPDLRPKMAPLGALDRGEELRQVLELAEQFPARHDPALSMPPFGPAPRS